MKPVSYFGRLEEYLIFFALKNKNELSQFLSGWDSLHPMYQVMLCVCE